MLKSASDNDVTMHIDEFKVVLHRKFMTLLIYVMKQFNIDAIVFDLSTYILYSYL